MKFIYDENIDKKCKKELDAYESIFGQKKKIDSFTINKEIINNFNGISFLGNSDDNALYANDIISNTITGSYYSGIYINYGKLTKIFGNEISGGTWGVSVNHGSPAYPSFSQNP